MFPRSFPAPPQAKTQLYTVSDTFVKDPTATWVYVEGIGGGAAGVNGVSGPATGGPGGLWDWVLIPAASITGPVQIIIGAGGTGSGGAGGDTKFGNFLICKGGPGLGNGIAASGLAAGLSGYADAAGGASNGSAGGNSVRGGGGGGGAASFATGNGGASLRAGNGGAANLNGLVPGGGGGAAYTGTPGLGARGQITVSQW